VRGLFVTGTDTGVGKSIVAAAICAALAARGERVAAFKPAVSGLDQPDPVWPPDHELLAAAASAGQSPDEVTPHRYGPPVSPHHAAELGAAAVDPAACVAQARALGAGADVLVCEGVGGLLVPLTADYLVRDLAVEIGVAVVVAARPGLGTINHTLLTLEAARSAGLTVTGVIMTPWPGEPSALELSNRVAVERLGSIPVHGLPPATLGTLAAAAASLPIEDLLTS
jgi:dethiobiotin synthetase